MGDQSKQKYSEKAHWNMISAVAETSEASIEEIKFHI